MTRRVRLALEFGGSLATLGFYSAGPPKTWWMHEAEVRLMSELLYVGHDTRQVDARSEARRTQYQDLVGFGLFISRSVLHEIPIRTGRYYPRPSLIFPTQ